ncbi:MAG: ParA family protein [Oscillospiraceae bacterium]|nr:ParA family protein [Oscillospiraceae bacterium]
MGIVIGVVNQKGGVGKTTTAVNVAAGLGAMGKKVLIVDFDPQGNATTGFGIKKKYLEATTYEVIMGEKRPQEAIIPTRYKNVKILPATSQLCEAELQLADVEQRNHQLRKVILQVKDDYDIVIIDCLPSLGILAINALIAVDRIIVPMVCEPFALEGLAQLMQTVKKVKRTSNKDLKFMGIVFTMVDKRLLASNEIMRDIRKSFESDLVFQTVIPRNVRVTEAQSVGEPIIYYDKNSKGGDAYERLAKEIWAKCREMEKKNG